MLQSFKVAEPISQQVRQAHNSFLLYQVANSFCKAQAITLSSG